MEINLMNQDRLTKQLENIRAAPRCGARTRAGAACQCPAIRGRKRCRIHGGLSPGAPRGEANGNFKDGFWTCKAVQERRWAKEMVEQYTKWTEE
jgi:glucans biosynthesis protein